MTTISTSSFATSPTTASATGTISSDFTTFLKMLTTQMQNQDPLNPMDSSDYATQLATFSGVEQQVKSNDLLSSLAGQFGVLAMAQLAGWVGQEARTTAAVSFDGQPVTLSPEPAAAADRAVLVVRDADGTIVSQEDIPVSSEDYQWLGGDDAGNVLPDGAYSLTVESYSGESLLSTTAVQHYAEIVEAQFGATGTTLMLQGGIRVSAADITALRRA